MSSTTLTNKISDLSTRVGEEIASIKTVAAGVTVQHSPADSRDEMIAAGDVYSVPAYLEGTGQLQVYLDGVLCCEGETYNEIESGSIAFVDDIPVDFDILVRVG